MGIKSYFQQRLLEKENKRNTRHKLLNNFMDMKSILVLCSVKSEKELQNWKVYFDNLPPHIKKVDIIAFINEKRNVEGKEEDVSEFVFYPHHLNWFGNLKEKSNIVKMIDYPYDLLIDLNFNHQYILNLLLVKSQSTLKVCSSSKNEISYYCDLIMKTDTAETKQKLYIDQVFYYLQQINSNGRS